MNSADATRHRPADPLSLLLAPVGVDEFLGSCADRRALRIAGSAEKFAGLGFDLDQFFLAAERFDPGARRLKAAAREPGEVERYIEILPNQARALYRAGLTICAAGLSDVHPQLGAFAEGVRQALSIPDLRFNAYLSPDGSGFNLHYDVQPIFLVQIAGRKRWWYGAEPVTPMPRRYSSAWAEKPPLESLEHTTLEPGDVLYLPAFTWHRARADGFSLGITLGTKGAHNEPLRSALLDSPLCGPWPATGMQPPLAPETLAPGEVPPAARAYLEAQLEALRAYAADLSVEALWERWVDQVQSAIGPRPPAGEHHLTSEDTLQRSHACPVHLRSAADGRLAVLHATRRALLPGSARPLVEWLLARDLPFGASEALAAGGDAGLTRAESKAILRDLLSLGVLAAAPAPRG